MPVQSYTAAEFRQAARHFTRETEVEVEGAHLFVRPSLVTPTDGSSPYYDTLFAKGWPGGHPFVLITSRRGWDTPTWKEVRRALSL